MKLPSPARKLSVLRRQPASYALLTLQRDCNLAHLFPLGKLSPDLHENSPRLPLRKPFPPFLAALTSSLPLANPIENP